MSKHKAKLEKLFEHPLSGNIDANKLIAALEHYGAKVEITKHHRVKVDMRDEDLVFSLSHRNELSKDTLVKIRHFLEKVGLTPDKL